MAKSDARFGYQSKLGREDFDLSQRLGFTSASGMLLPIWFDYATPGDSYYIQHDMPLLRSSNLAAPAMVDVKVHFETFFVPMQMIYQPFENALFGHNQVQSSFYNYEHLLNNTLPCFNYGAYISDIWNNQMYSDLHADGFRLADLMGLCPDAWCASTGTGQDIYTPSFFPWQLCAYQTIYQYYFRLDDKSQFSHYYCNIDGEYVNPTFNMPAGFMLIHQRPWNFDYFTSMYRSPIVSDANVQSIMSGHIYSDLINSYTVPVDVQGAAATNNNSKNAFVGNIETPFSDTNLARSMSTASIRQMFANEKLAMITGRTRKNYDSQVLAHYGQEVPHDVKHDLTMIHHDTYELKVQEVTQLATTSVGSEVSPLGELAGKSYAAGNGKPFKFTAPVHGVIMTIFSIEPMKRYISCFDRINAISSVFDFPTPEFDRLGNQPMFRYECGFNLNQTSFSMTDIIGWKERYYANKRKYDKTTYAFASGTGTGFNNYSAFMLSERPFGLSTNYAGWVGGNVDQRPELENRFYIERDAVDNLCLVKFAYGWKHSSDVGQESWSHNPWLVYARDPFIINSYIKAKKVSWMSKDGEPTYLY